MYFCVICRFIYLIAVFPGRVEVRLRCYPDPALQQVCRTVTSFNDELAEKAKKMLQAMRQNDGIGLAAPQVGLDICMFVANSTGREGDDMVFVNPTIVSRFGTESAEEGCLSFPGIFIKARRAQKVTLTYNDLRGNRREMEAEGLLARCIQQEIDHLEGRLLLDMMTPVQRIANRRRLRELRQRFQEQSAKTAAS
ncbi:MAG: peptide deformylase [Planctomycetia bacterium]|nr:peptide deformylase [Planctomycetia bacterium]